MLRPETDATECYKQLLHPGVAGVVLSPLLGRLAHEIEITNATLQISSVLTRKLRWNDTLGIPERHDLRYVVDSDVSVVAHTSLQPLDDDDDEDCFGAALRANCPSTGDDILESWLATLMEETEEEHKPEAHDEEAQEVESGISSSSSSNDGESERSSEHADAAEHGGEEETDIQRCIRELQLYEGEDGLLLDQSTETPVGKMRVFSANAPVLTCECHRHDRCVLVMSILHNTMDKWVRCLHWLRDGMSQTADVHAQGIREIKLSFGIRPRAKALPK